MPTMSNHSARADMTEAEREEREHFRKVVSAFVHYKRDSLERLRSSESNLRKLTLEHQKMYSRHGYQEHLKSLESCIEINYEVVKAIVADVANMFENVPSDDPSKEGSKETLLKQTNVDEADKVITTVKQFVRDWSVEGTEERKACYGPILDELTKVFDKIEDKSNIKVLVPGAGLGRLAFEIAQRGYECQGNEFSLYMLIAANFVLNHSRTTHCFKIYPWVHQFTNVLKKSDVLQMVTFPDVDPSDLPEDSKFSMVAGDFLEVYSDPEYTSSKDCIVTCFFIDCAHNILDYIELIHKILKPGGKWINFGPLLYHFADMMDELSIEPSFDIVRDLIEEVGFSIDKEETNLQATYMQRPTSMLQFTYKCVFFSCTKK